MPLVRLAFRSPFSSFILTPPPASGRALPLHPFVWVGQQSTGVFAERFFKLVLHYSVFVGLCFPVQYSFRLNGAGAGAGAWGGDAVGGSTPFRKGAVTAPPSSSSVRFEKVWELAPGCQGQPNGKPPDLPAIALAEGCR